MKTLTTLMLALLFSCSLAFAGGVPESEVNQTKQSWQEDSVKSSPELDKALEDARKAYMESEDARRFSEPAAPKERTTQPRAVAPAPRPAPQATPVAKPAPRPAPQPVQATKPAPRTTPKATAQQGWLLKANGTCSGLDSLTSQVGNFATPQEYARKMQQRGHQAFVLDLGDGQVKVKVPDQNQSLLFVESKHCR